MKVFHIITHIDMGGAERVAVNIAMSKSPGFEHHIVELQRGHSAFTRQMLTELKQNGIPFHRSWLPVYLHLHYYADRLVSILFPIRFLFLWLRYRPDVIHSHTEMPDMAVWLTLRLFPFIKVRLIRTIHNTCLWTGMGFIGPRVERLMQQEGTNVAISPGVQAAYHDRYGSAMPPIIYNGIAPTGQRTYTGIVPDKTNILFAGRFEEQKGITTLCTIIKALADDKRYHFHIFGAGRQQNIVDSLRDTGNVTIHPPLHGIAAIMRSFDYLIMPSAFEGLGLLSVEASMNGLPTLINSCPGLSDTLPADWPLAVHGNDIAEWIRLFRDILPHADRKALVIKAQDFVNKRFSIGEMQRKYELLYQQ